MRIAFIGKGGSGKSTISSLFALWAQDHWERVVMIDADVNQHAAFLSGLDEALVDRTPALGDSGTDIKNYVRGDNPLIPSAAVMVKTTPPGPGSRFFSLSDETNFLQSFITWKNKLGLIRTGHFCEDDLGVKCFHSKKGIVEIVLNHTLDKANELIVADMTAGTDAMASPLLSRFDLVVLIVEPTPLSMRVYDQFCACGHAMDVPMIIIGNKIMTSTDKDYVRGKITHSLALMPFLDDLAEWQKKRSSFLPSVEKLQSCFSFIRSEAGKCPRDWKNYWQKAVAFHEKNALAWASDAAGYDVRHQVDLDFLEHFSSPHP